EKVSPEPLSKTFLNWERNGLGAVFIVGVRLIVWLTVENGLEPFFFSYASAMVKRSKFRFG
ncbi:MAG: hypothetical protein J6N32_03040, partial [Clostridia bacterium]|nr:hypothetical protein [Clostridia bacterium]